MSAKTREEWSWSQVPETSLCEECNHPVVDHGCAVAHARMGWAMTAACTVPWCKCIGTAGAMAERTMRETAAFEALRHVCISEAVDAGFVKLGSRDVRCIKDNKPVSIPSRSYTLSCDKCNRTFAPALSDDNLRLYVETGAIYFLDSIVRNLALSKDYDKLSDCLEAVGRWHHAAEKVYVGMTLSAYALDSAMPLKVRQAACHSMGYCDTQDVRDTLAKLAAQNEVPTLRFTAENIIQYFTRPK